MADVTGAVFENVAEHFAGNFDESFFTSNQDGSIKILASVGKKKTYKNCDYCRASVASLIRGNCFGNQGPLIFI